jgi:hypothetical protein
MKNDPVSVVISTRKIDEDYVKLVKKSFSHPKTEILIYENNGEFSLAQLYNKGLDDLIIETTNVTPKIMRLFETHPEHGIIGLAGTTNLTTGMWWQDRDLMQGQVKHEYKGKVHRNNYSKTFGEDLKDVVIVDGLFFVVSKDRLKTRFDDEFPGFHFYELPFCVTNFVEGVKVGVTTKILVIHRSVGETDKKWEKNKLFFEAKYGHLLPLKTV